MRRALNSRLGPCFELFPLLEMYSNSEEDRAGCIIVVMKYSLIVLAIRFFRVAFGLVVIARC